MLEWVIKILQSLVDGKFTGNIQIRFKDGGVSSISRPKEKEGWTEIRKV